LERLLPDKPVCNIAAGSIVDEALPLIDHKRELFGNKHRSRVTPDDNNEGGRRDGADNGDGDDDDDDDDDDDQYIDDDDDDDDDDDTNDGHARVHDCRTQ
jgi:phosphopantothenoylcysteine synthetase/decarboxylase